MKPKSSITKAMRCRWILDEAVFRIQQYWWLIWNASIKRQWYRLFPSKDEFHTSYGTDLCAILALNPVRTDAYRADQLRRRMRIHER